jgi:hypothetical protein
MSRRAHQPTEKTRAEVETYAGVGLPHDQIGALLGIDDKTVRKYYRVELKLGEAKATANVAKTLYKQATNGNTAAAIFWMKARAGWREKHDVTIREGKPLDQCTPQELRDIADGRAP